MPEAEENVQATDKLVVKNSPEPDAKTTAPDNMAAPPSEPVPERVTKPEEPVDTDPHRGHGGAYYIDDEGIRRPVPKA